MSSRSGININLVDDTLKQETTAIVKEQSKFGNSSKNLWALGLLIGIPAASIIAYLVYKRAKANKNFIAKPSNASKIASSTQQKTASEKAAIKSNEDLSPLEKAIQVKNNGNKYFQQSNFEESIKCYSQAIELCPKDDCIELPKFYQNRAAAYENQVRIILN
jgi:mitochondrial import receptor subunit TOM70